MTKLGVAQRRWLLTLHLLLSAVLFGVTIAFLILSITAANTNDEGVLKACYTSMRVLAVTALKPSLIGALVSGILLSVLTHWGLFRFYWIIVKEGLTLLSIGLGPIGMSYWTEKTAALASAQGLNAFQDPAFYLSSRQLWAGIMLQILSLTAMFVVSVFKPWGSRRQK